MNTVTVQPSFPIEKKYSIIYADPPWQFKNKHTGGSMNSGAEQQYPTMTIEDICLLPVNSITADNAFLFMWWIASMSKEALDVVEAWGFKLKTMTAFTWVKQTVNDKDFFGMGFYTRQQAENCLIAVKGKPKVQNHSVRQLIKSTIRKHSKKPDETRDRIVTLCGDLPRIELFARNIYNGWDCWGNEV